LRHFCVYSELEASEVVRRAGVVPELLAGQRSIPMNAVAPCPAAAHEWPAAV